jgi:GNAT superfamily N-acetyltransferase
MAGIQTIRSGEPAARPDLVLRRFTSADIAFGMELKNTAGWNQTERDWQGYVEFEPDGCFVAENNGRPAGTATAVSYGTRFGWIGMVFVHPDRRRSGIGSALLRHAIDYLQRRGTTGVKLDATPMGRKVYVPLGFRDEYDVTRYEGVARAAGAGTDPDIASLTPDNLAAVTTLDAAAFGAERPAVLRSLATRNPELCLLLRERDEMGGYLIAREGQNALQIGPWIARDAAAAERLWRAFSARAAGRRVLVDVPAPNAAGSALIGRAGFTVQRGFTRMYLGENAHPGVPQQVFGTSGAEKG